MSGLFNALNVLYCWAAGGARSADTLQKPSSSDNFDQIYGGMRGRVAVLERNRVLYANPSFCKYFGYEGVSLEGRNIAEFIREQLLRKRR